MSQTKTEKRVAMSKRVARRWIRKKAREEHRLRVFLGGRSRSIVNLLRSFRDGKVAMENVPSIRNLGIDEGFDSVLVWASDRDSLVQLRDWFEERGFETTGVW